MTDAPRGIPDARRQHAVEWLRKRLDNNGDHVALADLSADEVVTFFTEYRRDGERETILGLARELRTGAEIGDVDFACAAWLEQKAKEIK